ncbi:MAG TPA: dephospho-CoA kinase [Longimicrobiaceae bacterium]|nr:dephospho-CoA kinase [Longimicrobiaceae bacterium]
MLKVGLTGNIAAGKSSVVRVWRALGAPVVDADELARRAVEPGTPALRAVVEAWGPGVLDPSGALDRGVLRRIVFADPDARARLEGIVHPAVYALREEEYRRAADRGEPLVVADIPLLFEVGLADEFDLIVLVDAPEEERLRRLVEDRGLDPGEARRMVSAQMPAELKRARADLVVENAGSREALEARAREVWAELARREEAARG